MDWMTDWIFDLLYGFQKTICYIIDFIREIFYTLAGLQPVSIDGEQTDLLSHFLLSDKVKTTFFYIFLIATILLVVFVLVAIIRSEYANGENKKSKTLILGKAFQSFLLFLLVPFILIAGITLTNAVMGAINTSMNPMLDDEELKKECRENVQKRVVERYNMNAVWNKLIDIWKNSVTFIY